MLLVVITFLLIAVGVGSYIYGAWRLSRYAARVSGGLGIAVFLLAPVTFWFAFYELEQDGKEFPTTMWLFGLVSTVVLTLVFWTPISYVATGRMDLLEQPVGVAEAAVDEYGDSEEGGDAPPPEEEPAPEVEKNAPAEEPTKTTGESATNGAAGTNQGGTAAATTQ